MNNDHPITPPPKLVQQWASESLATQHLCTQAARWGADQELEACCEWLDDDDDRATLRAARRPNPPSLKEQALALLDDASDRLDAVHENTIRRALEQLPDAL
jgi:hypothetical protein